jgi:hypothetical protein
MRRLSPDPESSTARYIAVDWTMPPSATDHRGAQAELIRFVHKQYIWRKLDALQEYLRLCGFRDVAPMRWTVRLLARKIRAYRVEHKYYDCI